MKNLYETPIDCSSFTSEKHDGVLVMKFKDSFLFKTTDLSVRDYLLGYLDYVEMDESVRTLVIMGYPEQKGCEEYYEFYNKVIKKEACQHAIMRMFNVLNQIILRIVSLNKIVVQGNTGKIISPYLNLSLACDYRIVTENTTFHNPCLDFGLIPKGGGAYFLVRMLGVGRALDFLLSEKYFSAYEALELGLVNKVVADDKLEETLVEQGKIFAEKPMTSTTGLKRLINYSYKDLKEYLEFENGELVHAIRKSKDWNTSGSCDHITSVQTSL